MSKGSFGVAAGLAFAIACGGGRRAPDLGPSMLAGAPAQPLAFASPATYRYHPRAAAPLLAECPLGSGRVLYAGQRGERWVADTAKKTAEAASELAPEELVAIIARTPVGFTFLGRTGTRYETSTPLGTFERSSTPKEPLARVRESRGALLGVRRDGTLARSEDGGAVWSPIGPTGVRFFDAALAPDGTGLAVAAREAVYTSRDAGLTWMKGPATAFGIEGLWADDKGIWLSTALGPRGFEPGATDPFPALPDRRRAQPRSLGGEPSLGPLALAARSGRAVVSGREWTEVRFGPPRGPHLLRGVLGAPLAALPVEAAQGCADVKLAGFGSVLYLACARQKPAAVAAPVEIKRSTDGGRTWVPEPYAVDSVFSQLALSVGASGDLVVSGVCSRTSAGPGCRPSGIHHRLTTEVDAGHRTSLEPLATPSLAGAALALTHSLDGRIVYALGRRTKGDALTVFVAGDGSPSFEAHEVEALRVADEDDRGYGRPGELAVESAAPSEDGTVGFVVNRRGKRVALVVDEAGRLVSVARPPSDFALMGVAGSRIFSVDPSSRESWESLDAGGTFSPLGRLPADPCPGARECPAEVVCFAAGCVIAESLTRVGWGPGPRSVLLPAREEAPEPPLPKVATPWSCNLESGEWRRVPDALGIPGADQSAIGKKAWFVATYDPRIGAASVISVPLGKAALEVTPLLRPVASPPETAVTVSVQIEGVAGLRYSLPKVEQAEVERIEVAFGNVLTGQTGYGVIPNGGAFRPDDVAPGRTGVTRAAPGLLSIATGGVYVRVHGALGDNQTTYFLDGRTVESFKGVSWPASVQGRGRTELVHAGRAHVPLRIDGPIIVRGGRSFEAVVAGWIRPGDFGLKQETGVAYVGQDAGLLVTVSDAFGMHSTSSISPFLSEGPLLGSEVPVPTQSDLGEKPRPCSATARARTPRVVASFRTGTRHPVIVNDPIEPLRVLLTGDAVLHGVPEDPCVAAYDAALVVSEAPGRAPDEHALIFPDAPDRAWLFRPTAATAPGLEFRTMSCRPDPAADVPPEVFKKEGTTIPASAAK